MADLKDWYVGTSGDYLAVGGGGTGATTASGARTNLGLGTIATQNSNNVTVTGGSIVGITDLAVADGGTGASSAADARTNLGLAIGTNVQAYSAELQGATQGGINGMKNRIINGAMMIDQRNAGASVTNTTSVLYTVDRFGIVGSQASKFTAQQSTIAPTGFINSLAITSSSAYTVGASEDFTVRQPIEGLNVADLGWGTASASPVTLSFWVRSSLTGTFGGSISNSAQDRFYVFSYTISAANTWEYKTITIAGDTTGTWLTTNGIGIRLFWSLGAGSTVSGTAGSWGTTFFRSATGATSVVGTNGATFYITGVQLEKGSTATSFDYRPYGTELALCQRYYYRAITGTLFNQLAFCNVRTTTSHYAFMQLPVTLRANPSSVDYGSIGVIATWGAAVTGLNSLTFADASYGTGTTQVLLNAVTSSAVGTVGQVSMLLGNNSTTGFVALNAEL